MKMLFAALALIVSAPVALAQTAPAAGVKASVEAADPARLAVAKRVVTKLVPSGSFKRMLDSSMGPMMDQMVGSVGNMRMADLVRVSGIAEDSLEGLGEGTLRDVMAVYDPYWDERTKLGTNAMMGEMGDLMAEMEPFVREALARGYAREFTLADLTELDRFFGTPVGARYAEKSYAMYMDPEVISAMSEMMPKIMQHLPKMVESLEAATAHLPKPKTNKDLTPAQRNKLEGLLGVRASSLAKDGKGEQ